jgi:twitching motility two-component system response regulator PilG
MTEKIALPTECLQLISQSKRSGCLIVTDPKNYLIQWKIYFLQGQINYATSLIGQPERLTYLGREFQTPLDVPISHLETNEYRAICNYWLSQKLVVNDLQDLCLKLTQETLIQVSALERSTVQFLPDEQVKPTVMNYSWRDFLEEFQTSIYQWKQLRSVISSPFNRLCLNTERIFDFYKAWQTWSREQEFVAIFGTQTLSTWLQSLSQKKCLYEIGTQMQVSPLTIATKLQPLVKIGAIQIFPFQEITAPTTPLDPQKSATTTISPLQVGEHQTISPPVAAVNQRESSVASRSTPLAIAENLDTRTSTFDSIIQQAQHPALPSPEDTRPLIVCVDDSKTVQQQVTRTLEAAGYQLISITDPPDALKVLIRYKPVLILLDINMPEINGYELCQMLNRSRKLREIPVVMLTGREGLVDRLRAKFIGASEYLTKPFDPNELIEVVQKLAPLSCSI